MGLESLAPRMTAVEGQLLQLRADLGPLR
jgi:hypothetical protein